MPASKGRRAALVAVPLVALLTFVAAPIARGTFEQLAWYPRDPDALDVVEIRHAARGILLTVRAPSGVQEVWRQETVPLPWRAQHHESPFFSTGEVEGEETLLVPYELSAGREWLLALKSQDGHWVSMSPYFPDAPSVSDDEWQELLAGSEARGAR